jgi:hypothetical protein
MSADDVHVYPLNDHWEHILDGTECPCEPRVETEGSTLIIVHNAWDHREIVEQAIDIMNGVDGNETLLS